VMLPGQPAGPPGMPTHKWSLTILGEFWPTTSTVAWQAAGEAHHHKGMEYSESAQVMRSLAGEVVASNDGRFADALHEQYWDNAIFLERLAEFEFACERVCQQVIDLVESAQDQMARIDAEADQEIDAITEGAKGTPAMVTVPPSVNTPVIHSLAMRRHLCRRPASRRLMEKPHRTPAAPFDPLFDGHHRSPPPVTSRYAARRVPDRRRRSRFAPGARRRRDHSCSPRPRPEPRPYSFPVSVLI